MYRRKQPTGKANAKIKLPTKKRTIRNSNLIVYTGDSGTNSQAWWGFTVKQGAATLHESKPVYKGAVCSLTMKVKQNSHIRSQFDSPKM